MYTLTFSAQTIQDAADHRIMGRQLYGAIVVPYSGIFTKKSGGASVTIPKIVCPYQVNDIVAIQEQWAQSGKSYVYKDYGPNAERNNQGYSFRSALTMPVEAARMFARIVSIRTWMVTPEIVNNFLPIGMNAGDCAGAAKVIDYYDVGNKLLSSIRQRRNKEVLAKTYQPLVTSSLPMVKYEVSYMLEKPYKPVLHVRGNTYTASNASSYAQAYETPSTKWTLTDWETGVSENRRDYSVSDGSEVKVGDPQPAGVPVDQTTHGRWQFLGMTPAEAAEHPDFIKIGPAIWDPSGRDANIYVVTDDKHNPLPSFQFYETKIVDPTKYLFVWLISAYLCDKDGKIRGDWFGRDHSTNG